MVIMKRLLILLLLCLLSQFSFAQKKKYIQSLDSLSYYFQFVTIHNDVNKRIKYQGFDSLISINTFHKKYFFNDKQDTLGNTEKSILILGYKFHKCILDLNVYNPDSIVIKNNSVILKDTSNYILYNSRLRLEHGKGFFHLYELEFKSENLFYRDKFCYFLKESIKNCNKYYKKPKILNIRKYDIFDEINN